MPPPALPPIYVISLARATARRANIKRRLNALGADYEIVDAVDGKALPPSQYKHRLSRLHRQMTPSEIGCFLSHHNLWRRIANGDDECALVLEDDAVWDDDFADIVNRVMNCEWHWEVVMLSEGTKTTAGRVLCDIGKRKLIRRHRRVIYTAAYLITRSGAATMHNYCQNIRIPVDFMLSEYWKHGAAFYCITPPPAGQSGEETTIGYDRYNTKQTITERVIHSILRKADRLQRAVYLLTNRPQKK